MGSGAVAVGASGWASCGRLVRPSACPCTCAHVRRSDTLSSMSIARACSVAVLRARKAGGYIFRRGEVLAVGVSVIPAVPLPFSSTVPPRILTTSAATGSGIQNEKKNFPRSISF